MEIKKGDKFLCIKDVIMQFTEEVTYNEGNVYISEKDGCITNNKGNINHSWAESLITRHYFKPLKEVDKMYTKATDLNGLEEKSYDEDPYNWVNNGLQDASVKKTFNPQPYYDNSKGSLYKVATERGWSSYIFDVVKRLERGGKKDPLRQEIEKSIDVLRIWLNELD